jgi:saccharopine dehydrogenase-like NADP-dependent oxidoreductase
MNTIHWLGAGLSSGPGIQTLIDKGERLILWNRTLEKAQALLGDNSPNCEARQLDFTQLAASLQAGDVLVSMLPADMHMQVAELALAGRAHFVSSSYVSEAMAQLHPHAAAAELCFVNEVGLDPGIDHLMAHGLVHAFRDWNGYRDGYKLQFRSYCGGFPAIANDFRYKFSWSPVGVLRALRSPARCIKNSQTVDVSRPWHAISEYPAQLPGGTESFQAYPNRDSLPFLQQYEFDANWQVDEFVRGTLRLPGWSAAWGDIFAEIETLEGAAGEQRLQAMSEDLWKTQSYQPGEADRVVLCVELQCVDESGTSQWHQSYALDSLGNELGSAMARLVSVPVALAVLSVMGKAIEPGVSTAPSSSAVIQQWFDALNDIGDAVCRRDHLAS